MKDDISLFLFEIKKKFYWKNEMYNGKDTSVRTEKKTQLTVIRRLTFGISLLFVFPICLNQS